MNLQLLSRLKTRDAAVIYEYLFNLNGRVAGKVADLSFETIAEGLNVQNVKTGRGSRFTAAVVRNRFSELEDVEVVEREETTPGFFNLYVYQPYPCAMKEDEVEDASEPVPDPYNGKTLFDYAVERVETTKSNAPVVHYHFHYENENENGNERQNHEHKEEYIYINKKINNQVSLNETDTACAVEEATENDERPCVADIRQRVDFTNDKVRRFREEIVRRAWEPEINPDLIDRVVGLAVLKINGANYKTCFRMIEEAKDAVARYDRTDGKAGAPFIWRTLNFKVKREFETAGWKWASTKVGHEPRPENKQAEAVAALMGD